MTNKIDWTKPIEMTTPQGERTFAARLIGKSDSVARKDYSYVVEGVAEGIPYHVNDAGMTRGGGLQARNVVERKSYIMVAYTPLGTNGTVRACIVAAPAKFKADKHTVGDKYLGHTILAITEFETTK